MQSPITKMISLFVVLFLRLTFARGTQVAMYKQRTSGKCGDSGGGWGKITSAAACGAGAAAVGWGDTTASTGSYSIPPTGCFITTWTNDFLYFNTQNPNVDCSSNRKCLCTLTCPPGTYQDQSGQSSCKTCGTGKYNGQQGQSSCESCASGQYQDQSGQSGQSSCKTCASGTYSTVGASSCPYSATTCPAGTYASGTASCDSCASGTYSTYNANTGSEITGGIASQSSNHAGSYFADNARDGNSGTFTHTSPSKDPWWQLNFATPQYINRVEVTNRKDCCGGRLDGAQVQVRSNDQWLNCGSTFSGAGNGDKHTRDCTGLGPNEKVTAVRISHSGSNKILSLAKVVVYNDQVGQSSESIACKNCGTGKYNDQVGKSSCKTCVSGQYSTVGASSCPYFFSTCPVGTYASGTAACDSCPTGKYQNEDGKAYCNNYCPYSKVLTLDARCIDNKVYKARTSGQCGDSGGGWGKITSAAQCDAGAAALGWGDTTAETFWGLQDPSGCFLATVNFGLLFNTGNSNVGCTSDVKCLCTLTCPPGTYQDQSGQSSCKTCASGTYSTVGASSCAYTATTCPAGTYASETATVCNSCVSGQYSTVGASSCPYFFSTCPVGTYASGTAACDSCPTGKYQNEKGKASCNNDCVNVLTLDARCIDNSVNGDPCLAGTYQDQSAQSSCKTCDDGTYSTVGASSCAYTATTCPAGTYASGTATVCNSCASGQYSTVGASSCSYTAKTCPAGTYASGISACETCGSGTYSTVGASTCKSCPTGKYNEQTSQTSCKSCEVGEYQNEVGQSSCMNDCASPKVITWDARCIDNKVYKVRSENPFGDQCGDSGGGWGKITSAAACGAGAAAFGWSDTTAQTVSWSGQPSGCYKHNQVLYFNTYSDYSGLCGHSGACLCTRTCPAGTYQNEVGQSSCKTCAGGTYSPAAGASSCPYSATTCPAGTYYASGTATICDSCASGTYSTFGASSCPYTATTCPAGTYASGTAAVCNSCDRGQYSTVGASSCPYSATACPVGTYTSGTAACDSCPTGKYNEQTGQTSESVACKSCDVGQYQNEEGKAEACKTCASGQYQYQSAQSSCKTCADGTYSTVGASSCEKCPEGHYLNYADDDSTCKQCPKQDGVGVHSNGTSCYRCLPGYYSANCEKCPVGRYTGWETNILYACHLCEGYQDEEGQGTCKKCPSGRISLANRTTCVTCPLGKYSDAENLNACKSCQNGEQHTGIIGQNMKVCTSGNMKGEFEYKTQNLIIYGYKAKLKVVAMNIHDAFETNCGANYYQNTFDGSCKICPVGLYKEADPQGLKIVGPNDFNTCRFCTAGRHAETNTCIDCALAADNYNEQILKDFPHQECRYAGCPEGSFAQNGECSECPAGTYWESKEDIVTGIQYEYSILHSCVQMETQFHAYLNATQRTLKKDQCEHCYKNPSLTLTDNGCQAGHDLRASTTTYPGLCRSCPVGQYQDSTGQVTCKSCSTATTRSATSC